MTAGVRGEGHRASGPMGQGAAHMIGAVGVRLIHDAPSRRVHRRSRAKASARARGPALAVPCGQADWVQGVGCGGESTRPRETVPRGRGLCAMGALGRTGPGPAQPEQVRYRCISTLTVRVPEAVIVSWVTAKELTLGDSSSICG
jgi:hypothetical protein